MSIRILRHHVQLPILVLLLLEAAFAVIALYLVATHWGSLPADQALPHWTTALLFAVAIVLASGAMGLYNTRLREHLFGLALRFLLVAVMVLAAIGVALFSYPQVAPDTRRFRDRGRPDDRCGTHRPLPAGSFRQRRFPEDARAGLSAPAGRPRASPT